MAAKENDHFSVIVPAFLTLFPPENSCLFCRFLNRIKIVKIDATTSEFNMKNYSQDITTNQFQRQLRVSSSKQTLLRISQSFKEKHRLELV